MAQVIVRNLEEAVVQAWKLKAELSGRSLEQELRLLLEQQAPLSAEQKVEMFRRVQAMTPKGVKQTPAEDLIREDRDNDEPYR